MQKSLIITAIEDCAKANDIILNERDIELIAEKVDDVKSDTLEYYKSVAYDASTQFNHEYKNHLVTANLLEECRTNLGFQTRLANDFRERLLKAQTRQRRTDNFVFFLIIVILFGVIMWGVKMHS